MKDNTQFSRQRKPSREAIDALMDMYAQNSSLKKLVKTFDLDLRTAAVVPYTPQTENLTRQHNSKEIIKQYTTMSTTAKTTAATSKKKFTNEAEETPLMPFLKFENKGDVVEGILTGEKTKIKGDGGERDAYVLEVDSEPHVIPTSIQLTRKLENVLKVSEGQAIEIQITFDGKAKVEGVANPMNQYTVKY